MLIIDEKPLTPEPYEFTSAFYGIGNEETGFGPRRRSLEAQIAIVCFIEREEPWGRRMRSPRSLDVILDHFLLSS
jgi:hypothetical protein